MDNPVYQEALARLRQIFGSPQPMASGTGARFVSSKKGKATLYHQGIAPGNRAELAFEVESIAKRMGVGIGEARNFLQELKTLTGREIEPNAQFNWPRVGFQTTEDVETVSMALTKRLGSS